MVCPPPLSGTSPVADLTRLSPPSLAVLPAALLAKGCEVTVFERDASAIRGEGKYRGPIQVQSNALAALEAVDQGVATAVMQAGCITVRADPTLSPQEKAQGA